MGSHPVIEFIAAQAPELWVRTGEHLFLAGVSTSIAVLAGVPLGIWITRSSLVRGPVLGVASTLQTVPSLALLAFLLPFLGLGVTPAIVALLLYALLPIVRNTYTGLSGVPPEVQEAARGLGFTPGQQLRIVDLPLALPVIVAGVRTAAVIGVGIATLAAAIGAGGLGVFIFRGLAMVNEQLILLGALPAAALALALDGAIGAVQRALGPRERRPARQSTARRRLALAGAALILLGAVALVGMQARQERRERVVIGSKNFTEQFLLGELMAQLIEARTELSAERQFGLDTGILHEALLRGEIDLYAEYTGTALTALLERPVPEEPEAVFPVVDALYEELFDLRWLPPFGFNNTYALAVRAADAEEHGWTTISDLAPAAAELRAGFTSEFAERPDGYPGLREAYGFGFGGARDMEPGLMYQAVAQGDVDVISAFATDGRIARYDLALLEDDRRFFPPYDAAVVARGALLRAHPEIEDALAPLEGALDEATMQRLNYEVDEQRRDPAEVARAYLQERGLLAAAGAASRSGER